MKKTICAVLVAALLGVCGVALGEGASLGRFDFATVDLDGNAVSSAEICAGNRMGLPFDGASHNPQKQIRRVTAVLFFFGAPLVKGVIIW